MAGPSDMFVLFFANLNQVDPGSSGGRKAEPALGWNKYAWIITYQERNRTGRSSDTERKQGEMSSSSLVLLEDMQISVNGMYIATSTVVTW